MNPIKIVIWDLDDTLWQGTLSESGVAVDSAVLETVRELSARGIINSIASKNDEAAARNELERLGIWEEFVFPEIAWAPKGPAIARLLDHCRLRAANALFLDDNRSNREEARYYNPGIEVRGPEFIGNLLTDAALRGKPDPDRRRPAQYKQLERRSREQRSFGDNRAFLDQSRIEVERVEELGPHRERISELIGRTNQLNFTKVRLPPIALDGLLNDPGIASLGFRVRDRYGDYGLVGFAAWTGKRIALSISFSRAACCTLGRAVGVARAWQAGGGSSGRDCGAARLSFRTGVDPSGFASISYSKLARCAARGDTAAANEDSAQRRLRPRTDGSLLELCRTRC